MTDYDDIHADENAEYDDTRMSIETSGTSVIIQRERYALVKFNASELYYDWFVDEKFRLKRGEEVPEVIAGLESTSSSKRDSEKDNIDEIDNND